MNIQFLNGGLGNQTFQYIFSRFMTLCSVTNEPCFLDDTYFALNSVHNGYELDKVFPNSKPMLLKNTLDSDIWDFLIDNKRNGISVPQSFKNIGFPVTMLAEYSNYTEFNPFDGNISGIPANSFIPELGKITSAGSASEDEIFYFHTYSLHPGYFTSCKDILINELEFAPLAKEDTDNQKYMDSILNSESVAVHIRRGDFVSLGITTSDSFYKESITDVLNHYPNCTLYVFSDDITWCRNNMSNIGLDMTNKVIFIEGNLAGRNYIDMYLMSNCEAIICGNSSFSQLAMLLDKRLKYFKSTIIK